ncbi:sigma-70 family RNA polymerase sigma factor, partial [bacterium]|nr:sigma-70 family RNA polymerase sigma factor [bacterium]
AIFGSEFLDQVDDIVQETLIKAMRSWPIQGWPKNPSAWLKKVAKNLAIDRFRQETLERNRAKSLSLELRIDQDKMSNLEFFLEEENDNDGLLKMLFLANHPSFSLENRMIFSLKMVLGLGVTEIAAAFLMKKETVSQRFVRLKKQIRQDKIKFHLPSEERLHARLDSVLTTLYLMFNEGYKCSVGSKLYDVELCKEAILLIGNLLKNERFQLSKVHALMALMLFQFARFNSRLNSNDKIIELKDQCRDSWDWAIIDLAFEHLQKSMGDKQLSIYHLEAGILACHCSKKNYEDTNWAEILAYYDLLLKKKPSPITFLNRTIAYSKVYGPQKALIEIKNIQNNKKLKSYYYLDFAIADFHENCGDIQSASLFYKQALPKISNQVEIAFVKEKILELAKYIL